MSELLEIVMIVLCLIFFGYIAGIASKFTNTVYNAKLLTNAEVL